jgi:hypothetical protein
MQKIPLFFPRDIKAKLNGFKKRSHASAHIIVLPGAEGSLEK